MAIATVNDIVSGLDSSQRQSYLKILSAPKAAGSYQSAWLATGQPGAGAAPPLYTAGSGYTCDKSTAGAIPYTNGSVQNWIARMSGQSGVRGTLVLYDRLWSCSGIPFGAATYSVTTPGTLPARITDGGVGCELWSEQFIAGGAASGTLTVTYVNTAATGGRSGILGAVVSAPVIGQMQQIPLQVGDLGISQITSTANSATWTSGSRGLTIMKRICEIPVAYQGGSNTFDWAQVLSRVPPDACLGLYWLAETATAPTVAGLIAIIDK